VSPTTRVWQVPETSDPDARREVRLIYGVARPQVLIYVAAAALLAIPGVTGPAASRASVVLLLVSAAIQAGALVLVHRGQRVAAGRLVVATTLGTAMLSVSLIGGLRGTLAATLLLAILVAGIVRGWRSAGWAAGAAGLYAVVEHLAEGAGLAPLVQAAMFPGAAVVSTVAMLGIVVALLAFYAREIERAVEAKERLERELLDARRMEGIGRLAGGVAHDFRNLLTPIIVNARTLAEGALEDAPELAAEIEAAAQRANALTGQLLAFARRQLLEPQLLDVGAVVRGLEPILRRVVREDVAFELRLAAGLPAVRADRTQLEQVVVNLVANACDAMPRGGQLLVAAAAVNAAPAAGGPPAPHVALLVSDTGLGMSDEVRRRIFEPFFTTKERGRGVGLGLATVHGIVTQTGGTVQVESEPGRGSTFRVLLPAAAGVAEAPAPEPATLADFAPGTRVLVADDAPLVRQSIARVLRARGLEVLEAEDGLAALAAARVAPGPLDLLVTDVVMPGLAGPELAAELRRAQPGLAVLFISGYADAGVVEHGQVAPDVELLPKPFTPDQLLARVAEVLGRRGGVRKVG